MARMRRDFDVAHNLVRFVRKREKKCNLKVRFMANGAKGNWLEKFAYVFQIYFIIDKIQNRYGGACEEKFI